MIVCNLYFDSMFSIVLNGLILISHAFGIYDLLMCLCAWCAPPGCLGDSVTSEKTCPLKSGACISCMLCKSVAFYLICEVWNAKSVFNLIREMGGTCASESLNKQS